MDRRLLLIKYITVLYFYLVKIKNQKVYNYVSHLTNILYDIIIVSYSTGVIWYHSCWCRPCYILVFV